MVVQKYFLKKICQRTNVMVGCEIHCITLVSKFSVCYSEFPVQQRNLVTLLITRMLMLLQLSSLFYLYTHPSIICSRLSCTGSQASWSLSQLTLGERRGTPWTSRQVIAGLTHGNNQPFTLTFTPTVNLESPVNLTCMSLDCGGNRSTLRKPTRTWGEHANSTQKSPCRLLNSNPGPSCCEATVLRPSLKKSVSCPPGSPYQDLFTKSRPKSNPLFPKCFSPKHLLRQKSDGSHWNYENEDNFVACQDLTSRSSQRLQHLERTLLSLRSQCHVLHGSGGCLRGCITGLSTSGEAEFYHHPQAAAFSQHYAQLQHLLEQRAQLLFLHEYGRRCRAARCFITRLGDVLGKACLLASRGQSSKEHDDCSWNLELRAMCEELQVHISHWDMLHARVRADPFLRTVFSHTEMLHSMQRGLWLLGQQALLLMENCMHTLLKALAAAQLVCVPRDALEDLLSTVELYNHIITKLRSQKRAAAWSLQILFTSDCSQINSGLPRKQIRPGALLVVEIMRIVAQHRAQIAARQLYSWTCQQTDLLSLAGQTSTKWGDLRNCLDLLVPPTSDQSKSILDETPKKSLHGFWSSSLPLFDFTYQDREDILVILFQVLVSSTDLLAPHIPKRPQLERSASAESGCRTSGREENPKICPSRIQNTAQRMDLSNMDACVALFSQYRGMLWREFGKAVIKRFYYPSHNSILGGMNQWNDQMVFLLVRWLKQACKEELVPAECKDVLNKFCSHILSTAAFIYWDAIMCESLGLGMKDKCLPRAMMEPCTVRTATMELALQLFPPLLSVLQLLQNPHTNLGEKGTRSLGLLCRAQATVQSSIFWVVSKAYQFLASWSLTKFVLITQGDLKALRETVENLVQQLNPVLGSTDHHDQQHLIMEYGLQLSHALSQLQAFSELFLRIFSMDCKKMSMEIFEQTMPSAKHWRVNYKTELPSTPSDYAAFAVQSVLGQVLEGVQPLPDETRIPALTEAMTAFMEAWMEHILKQKIKFSVHGALQLKQDFDLIREFIRSEKYSLSEELHHRLLSLRVFHQVDRAIVCLLQQPVTKPYMSSQRWEPFRHCSRKPVLIAGIHGASSDIHRGHLFAQTGPRWWTRQLEASIIWRL
ncbi:uncharacterized protein ccdc142 isoform X3 [Neoarius graeffei]|uniref:uncharacterized protein ccdc142 isoform X3 n=1 Tax=Neoarius graeffei TaxID=443677 RepID=UPI00298D4DD9|nr:uncharacterized protein ccdc142 isoform X3 [Neoarius graeffei]